MNGSLYDHKNHLIIFKNIKNKKKTDVVVSLIYQIYESFGHVHEQKSTNNELRI